MKTLKDVLDERSEPTVDARRGLSNGSHNQAEQRYFALLSMTRVAGATSILLLKLFILTKPVNSNPHGTTFAGATCD